MPRRLLLLPGLALLALGAVTPTASATDFWVTPDETRTSGQCLTRETACALGYAQDQVPEIPFLTPPIDVHRLLLLPGRYDRDDINAGSTATNHQPLKVQRALTIQGVPGEAVPVIDLSGLEPGYDGVQLQYGGVLRDLTVVSSSGQSVVRAVGRGPQPNEAALPAILERVTIRGTGTTASAATLVGNVLVRNSVIVHAGESGGEGVTSGASAGGGPRLVGNTVLAPKGRAVAIYGARGDDPDHHEFVDNIIRGNADISVYAGGGAIPDTGPVSLDVSHNALRDGGVTSIETFGPVTVNRVGNISVGDVIPIADDGTPQPGSALVDAGVADPGLGPVDFFGAARVFGAAPDIGAVELGGARPGAASATPAPSPVPATPPFPLPSAPTGYAAPARATKPSVSAPKAITRKRLVASKGLTLRAVVAAPVRSATVELIRTKTRKGGKSRTLRLAIARASGKGTELSFALKVKASKLAKGRQKLGLRYTFVDGAGRKTVVDRPVTVR